MSNHSDAGASQLSPASLTPPAHSPSNSTPPSPRSRQASGPSRTPSCQLPDPGSINDLLRKTCRERLYVSPLRWTWRQLDLLQCRFTNDRGVASAFETSRKRKAEAAGAEQDKNEHGATNDAIDLPMDGGGTNSADRCTLSDVATSAKVQEMLHHLKTGGMPWFPQIIVRELLEHQGLSPLE